MTSMILDGSGFIFRAYYGLPELHDRDGHNINAVFGFFRMLLKLLDKKPKHFVIARDSPVRTIRREQVVTYKANRVSLPDDLKWQLPRIKELVEEVNIPALQVGGYEADDIIGTLIKHSIWKNDDLCVVSSDKDLKQLIQPSVTVYDPSKESTTDVASFTAEFGFTPMQFVDYLSLIGDSSDNVPGVSGIGPKTALDLIQRFHTIEGIYENLEKISPKVAEKLRVGQLQGQESKQLVTLMDVPELSTAMMDDFVYTPDFKQRHDILVEKYHLHSLEWLIHSLKKNRQAGEQLSLFG